MLATPIGGPEALLDAATAIWEHTMKTYEVSWWQKIDVVLVSFSILAVSCTVFFLMFLLFPHAW